MAYERGLDIGHRRAAVATAAGLLVTSACASILFEESPYTIRNLRLVYSAQENLTFFTWNLGEDADPDRVRFELFDGNRFRDIDLEETVFVAEPFACPDPGLCFQFQVRGRYQPGRDAGPLRSIHDDEGMFAGPLADLEEVAVTLSISPMPLGHNREIDAELVDWFEAHEVPQKRSFQYQLVASGAACAAPAGSGWAKLDGAIAVDYAWVEAPACLAVRPKARQHDGTVVIASLTPSAETVSERQRYEPPRFNSPIVYAVLLDLHIPNAQRCAAITSTLLTTLHAAITARGATTELGVFRPVVPPGNDALNGCDQTDTTRRYPVTEMISAALEWADHSPTPLFRITWVYANNLEAELLPGLYDDLALLTGGWYGDRQVDVHNWGIGSNTILDSIPWDTTTGWRPIEDETFSADIVAQAKQTLPFATMLHDDFTEVPIHAPADAGTPRMLKLCRTTPTAWVLVGTTPGDPAFNVSTPAVDWPQSSVVTPYYLIALGEQYLVPRQAYVEHEIDALVETCQRFCHNPFRAANGDEYPDWSRTPNPNAMERCQCR